MSLHQSPTEKKRACKPDTSDRITDINWIKSPTMSLVVSGGSGLGHRSHPPVLLVLIGPRHTRCTRRRTGARSRPHDSANRLTFGRTAAAPAGRQIPRGGIGDGKQRRSLSRLSPNQRLQSLIFCKKKQENDQSDQTKATRQLSIADPKYLAGLKNRLT